MTISMYNASIPVLTRMLGNLESILDKAIAHAAARKIDDAAFVEARLFPDMFTFARQIRVATDMAKGAGARLAGVEIPKFEDNEKTLAELKARVAKAIAFLKTLTPAQIDGSEGKAIEGANTIELNLEKLSSGMYIVQLVKDGSRQQVSLIKQ